MICGKISMHAVYFLSERWTWKKCWEQASDESDSRGQNTSSHVIHPRGRGILGTLNSEIIEFTEWKHSDNYWRVVILWYYSLVRSFSHFLSSKCQKLSYQRIFRLFMMEGKKCICVFCLNFTLCPNPKYLLRMSELHNLFIKCLMTRNKSVKVLSDSYRKIWI